MQLEFLNKLFKWTQPQCLNEMLNKLLRLDKEKKKVIRIFLCLNAIFKKVFYF